MGFEFTWQTGVELLSEFLTAKATLTAVDTLDAPRGLGRVGELFGLEGGPEKVVLYHYSQISDAIGAEYSEIQIRGRSQPFLNYVRTNTNKINFEAKLVAGADVAGLTSPDDVWRNALLLKSWLYPTYKDNQVEAPPVLQLDVGTLYQGVRGIIRSLDLQAERPWTIDHKPYVVTANIEFEIFYSKPVDRSHIREGMRDTGATSNNRVGYLAEKVGLGGAYNARSSVFKAETYTTAFGTAADKVKGVGTKVKNGLKAGRGKNPAALLG